MINTSGDHVRTETRAGGELEVFRGGSGPTVVLLHGSYGWWGWEPCLERLAEHFTVIAPAHPGFGHSTRLPGIDTVDDLAYYYLDYLAEAGLAPAAIVGFGFGGWLAAEIAVRTPAAVAKLVLVDAVGIKISDRETRDIGDPFILFGAELQASLLHDPLTYQVPVAHAGMPSDQLEVVLRNQEAAMFYGWKPYMHNPKLRQRLHRIGCPTLVVWGENDQIVTPAYGQAYAAAIPNARFVPIANAGHYPQREQVDQFSATLVDFLR